MIKKFNDFFDYYIGIVQSQVPDYEKYLDMENGYKHIHPIMNPLTPKQVEEVNTTIRNLIKIPKLVTLLYDRNAYTFYSYFDEARKKMIIAYPSVSFYFQEYPTILKGAVKHEMGHILNGDIFIHQKGHSQCLNVCMDARINTHIPHEDMDYLVRCLFDFKNEPSTNYIKADKFYEKIHLPVVEGGYSWETAHSHFHLFDEPQAGICGRPGQGGGEEGTEGGGCDPSIIDEINRIFGDKPNPEGVGEDEGGEEGGGDEDGGQEGGGENGKPGNGKGGNGKKPGDGKGEDGNGGTEGGGKQGDVTKAAREMKKLDKIIRESISALNKIKENL